MLDADRFLGSGEARYPTSISSGGPSWKETRWPLFDWGWGGVDLKRSGFARGRVERRWGA